MLTLCSFDSPEVISSKVVTIAAYRIQQLHQLHAFYLPILYPRVVLEHLLLTRVLVIITGHSYRLIGLEWTVETVRSMSHVVVVTAYITAIYLLDNRTKSRLSNWNFEDSSNIF